jgi:hypothetical protein
MSAISVQTPFPIFNDIDGQPLEAGYIFVGVANLDPQVNPVAVFFDKALTQPAGQPIRTMGGYAVNSGTPTNLYTGSDYSIRVTNNNGSVIYSAPVSQTSQDKTRENLSTLDFGAVGDSSTDNTTVFLNFESTTRGQPVDLLGLVYLLSKVPVGNDYYNGAFKVGSEIYWQNRNPRSHPFEGPATSLRHIKPRTGEYLGLSFGHFPRSDKGMVLVWRQATTHAVQNGTRLKVAFTDDGGRTLQAFPDPNQDQSFRTISYAQDADTRNFSSGIINGRFVIVTTRREEPQSLSNYQDPLSIFSDDEGITWTTAAITGLTNKAINFHGRVYPWEGGGVNGAIVYYYAAGGIGALTSTNRGSSWTNIGIVVTAGPFTSISEMSVTQIGSEEKYVMVMRTSSTGNFGVSTSTNLTTWTTTVNSGVLLKGNPPELLYADGKLFMVTVSRRNQAILVGYENALLIAEGNVDLVYSSGGVSGWSGWKVVSQLGFWPAGYLTTAQVRGRWYALMTGSEETAGASTGRTAYMAMLSTDLVDVADTRSLLEAVPQFNLVSNGLMEYWPRGTSFSFTVPTIRTLILPGFTFSRSSNLEGSTLSQISGDAHRFAMRVRRNDGNSLTQSMNLTHTLTQADSSKFKINNEYLGLQFRCRKGTGFSAAAGFLTVQVRDTSTINEQQATTSSGTFPIGDRTVQSASTGITPTENWESYQMNVGPVPSDSTQLLIRWTWTPIGIADDDYFDLEGVTLFVGKQRSPVINRTYVEAVNSTLPFFWSATVQSQNGSRWISFPAVMHRVPSITVSAGSVSSVSTNGFELTHTSAVAVTVIAEAWL